MRSVRSSTLYDMIDAKTRGLLKLPEGVIGSNESVAPKEFSEAEHDWPAVNPLKEVTETEVVGAISAGGAVPSKLLARLEADPAARKAVDPRLLESLRTEARKWAARKSGKPSAEVSTLPPALGTMQASLIHRTTDALTGPPTDAPSDEKAGEVRSVEEEEEKKCLRIIPR